jgi:hypothetical protein
MKLAILLCMTLLLSPLPVTAQQPSQGKDNELSHKDLTITGCLTKNTLKEYELVDEEGTDNLPYSSTVDLDKYVGHTVTLVGRRAATPSAETSAGPVKTHFMVKKVESASGECNKK